eukprot:20896-Heterococcus_DN1.PRE.1
MQALSPSRPHATQNDFVAFAMHKRIALLRHAAAHKPRRVTFPRNGRNGFFRDHERSTLAQQSSIRSQHNAAQRDVPQLVLVRTAATECEDPMQKNSSLHHAHHTNMQQVYHLPCAVAAGHALFTDGIVFCAAHKRSATRSAKLKSHLQAVARHVKELSEGGCLRVGALTVMST